MYPLVFRSCAHIERCKSARRPRDSVSGDENNARVKMMRSIGRWERNGRRRWRNWRVPVESWSSTSRVTTCVEPFVSRQWANLDEFRVRDVVVALLEVQEVHTYQRVNLRPPPSPRCSLTDESFTGTIVFAARVSPMVQKEAKVCRSGFVRFVKCWYTAAVAVDSSLMLVERGGIVGKILRRYRQICCMESVFGMGFEISSPMWNIWMEIDGNGLRNLTNLVNDLCGNFVSRNLVRIYKTCILISIHLL